MGVEDGVENPAGYPINRFSFCKTTDSALIGDSDGGAIPRITNELLQQKVSRKNQLKQNYQPCDQNWLIFHFGGSFAFNFNRNWYVKEFDLQSDFNRVYLLDESADHLSKRVY